MLVSAVRNVGYPFLYKERVVIGHIIAEQLGFCNWLCRLVAFV